MTDEQRKQFEEWQATRPWAITESAYDLAFAAWLARDAEVQALREALEKIVHDSKWWRHADGLCRPALTAWEIAASIARAALAGQEENHD